MSADDFPIPETHVLAVASHVVYGNVGNTMAAQVLRFMGCDVAALNTVQFSNHTGYKQVRGTKATAEEIMALFEGLQQNQLTDFDVMLSGYAPGAAAVNAVGTIARELKATRTSPGSFFWVLDPVMGDQGKLYVSPDVVPAYQALLHDADLILPNQFELEVLTDSSVGSFPDLKVALHRLHTAYDVPHVVVTSVRLPTSANDASGATSRPTLAVVGSSRTAGGHPRAFRIEVPDIDCYFSGTGDMFAALLVARLRQVVGQLPGLTSTPHWLPDDAVPAVQLPLCGAVRKVLASMARVLEQTKLVRDRVMANSPTATPVVDETVEDAALRQHLISTKAAEIRLARHARWLLDPQLDFEALEL